MASQPATVISRLARRTPNGGAGWRGWLLAACLLAAGSTAHAAVRARVQALSMPGLELGDVTLDAALAANGRPQLTVHVARVSVPALGWRDVAVDLQGQPAQAGGAAWKFSGSVKTARAPGDALSDAGLEIVFDPDGGGVEVDVAQAQARVRALLPLDQATHVQLKLTGVPLQWLRGVLTAAWPAGRLQGGSIGGTVALDLASGDSRVSGRVNVQDANLDTQAGNIATQKLDADGSFRIESTTASSNLMFDGSLHGGELLLGPLYAQLPNHAANLHVAASFNPAGSSIDALQFDDHDALRLEGKLGFDRHGALDSLDLKRFAATFPAAYTRYGTTLVQGWTGWTGLTTSGSLVGAFASDPRGLRTLQMTADHFALDGAGNSFGVAGLDGSIDWLAGASRPASTLHWDALALYRVVFGPGKLGFAEHGGVLTLESPARLPVFGGALQLNRFAWSPVARETPRVAAGFAVTGVDVAQLCAAFGWPAFGGKLGGAVPDVVYHDGKLTFDGGLSVNAFDGSVSVTDLSMQDPFGATPALAADIDMHGLDLAQLTSAFDFGAISGRMHGHIHGLRLVGWKATTFTAQLAADDGGKISQHALKSLTDVGGGGIAGGLQSMALRLFKNFGYARIGLACTLKDGVCSMAGVTPDPDANADGYTIVEGRGLPRIRVIGHQREVDWPTLVARLSAATSGAGPVIK